MNNRLREERGRSKRLMRPTPAHAGHRKNGRGREVLEWQTLRGAVSRRLSQEGAAGGNSGRFFVHRATRRPEVIVQIRTTPRPRSKAMDVPYGFDWSLIRLTIRSAVSAVAIDGVPRS